VLRSLWSQVALSVAVVAVIVWRVPFATLRADFRNLEYSSFLLAIFGFLVLLILRVYKWHRLMGAVGNGHIRRSLRSLFGGFALGLITPGRLGELGRCIFVREEERAQVALLTLLDRLLDVWALLTLVGASLFFLVPHAAAIFGAAVWLALLPVVMSFPKLVAHFAKLVRRSWHFHGHVADAAKELHGVQTPPFAILAVVAAGTELASFFFLLRAFFPTEFSTAVATFPYIILAGDLPLTFSGVGVREGAAAVLLSPYAVPASAAVNASLLWFVFAILVPAALGSAWLLVEKSKSRFRRTDAQFAEVVQAANPGPRPMKNELPTPSAAQDSITPMNS
jgi:hypothetical protein